MANGMNVCVAGWLGPRTGNRESNIREGSPTNEASGHERTHLWSIELDTLLGAMTLSVKEREFVVHARGRLSNYGVPGTVQCMTTLSYFEVCTKHFICDNSLNFVVHAV